MKTQFTPGPWFSNGQYIEDQHGTIAKVMRPEDNAALITATPEMFEALESAINWMVDPVITDWLNRSGVLGNYGTVVINARAALAKAKGEL